MRFFTLFIFMFSIAACRTPVRKSKLAEVKDDESWMEHSLPRPTKLNQCVAFRGNGNYIFAHWHSLARLVENYGLFDAYAGSSSGSITSFFYESIYKNPAIVTCKDHKCDDDEKKLRVALLLKTLNGFADVISKRSFGKVFTAAREILNQMDSSPYQTAAQIKALVKHDGLEDLINPRYLALIEEAINKPETAAKNIPLLKSALEALKWEAADAGIFLRDGVVNFREVSNHIVDIGNFYAGRDPVSLRGIKKFLDACASKNFNLSWPEMRNKPLTSSVTCGHGFDDLANTYLDRLSRKSVQLSKDRGNDSVGQLMPGLVSTSIIMDQPGINAVKEALDQYESAQTFEEASRMKVIPKLDFKQSVRFGYWGQTKDVNKTRTGIKKYLTLPFEQDQIEDLKSERFWPLYEISWRDAMAVGPQEPGLGSMRCKTALGTWKDLADADDDCKLVSAGGWSDLEPTLVLKAMGCEKVVLITRKGPTSKFVNQLSTVLQIPEDSQSRLFDFVNNPTIPDSSVKLSLREADAVWCTTWDKVEPTDLRGLNYNSYCQADLVTDDPYFAGKSMSCANELNVRVKRSLTKTRQESNAIGCAFGATGM